MIQKNATVTRLLILLTLVGIAVLSTAALCAGTQKSKLVMVQAVTTADADTSSSEVNIITSDDFFARVYVSPNTSISRNGAVIAFDKIKRGCKITCKGNWDKNSSNVFNAAYIFIGGVVTESDVSDRVAAACRKIANKGTAHNSSNISTKSVSASKERPQLELTDWIYKQDEDDIGREWGKILSCVSGKVKNLSNRPMTVLTATAHFYTGNGKYIGSSFPKEIDFAEYCSLGVKPDKTASFTIKISWVVDAYPEMPTKCVVEFSCSNLGDLRTNPTVLKLDAQPFGQPGHPVSDFDRY